MLYILFAILLFGFLIATHEFGHFAVAKLCGVRVNEFSIGMGPLLLKKQGKETLYSLRLFPIGGFCAMEGEDEATDDLRSFARASGWKRFCILIAGAAMNFLTGLVVLLCIYSSVQSFVVPVLSGFSDGCQAAEEGYLQQGDEILSIDGYRVLLYDDITTLLSRGNGKTADLVIRRNGEKHVLSDVPLALHDYTENGQTVRRYGLQFTVVPATVGMRLTNAVHCALNFARMVWFGLEDIFSGAAGVKDLSGPIGIVDTMSSVGQSSASWQEALLNLLYFGAFIAVNLAVMNLLPLPALDGGRIFFLILNAVLAKVIRRKIPGKYEGAVHLIGMGLLLLLMVIVGANDILRLIRR